MFEKIKEYQFVLIIGLVAGVALVYSIVTYQANKTGTDTISSVQNSVVDVYSKSNTYKNSHTIADAIIDSLTGKSLGTYQIETASWVLFFNNSDWETVVSDWAGNLSGVAAVDWKIFPVILPTKKIGDIDWENAVFLKSKEIDKTNGKFLKDASDATSAQKWYLTDFYFGFWPFETEADAKKFADKYLKWADIIKDKDKGNYYVVQQQGQ